MLCLASCEAASWPHETVIPRSRMVVSSQDPGKMALCDHQLSQERPGWIYLLTVEQEDGEGQLEWQNAGQQGLCKVVRATLAGAGAS